MLTSCLPTVLCAVLSLITLHSCGSCEHLHVDHVQDWSKHADCFFFSFTCLLSKPAFANTGVTAVSRQWGERRAVGSDWIQEGDAAGTSRSMLLVLFHVISFIEGRRSRSKLTLPLGLHKQRQAVFDETWLKLWCRYCSGVQTHPPQNEFSHHVFFKRAVLSSHPSKSYCLAGHRDSGLTVVQTSLSQPLALLFGHWIGDVLKPSEKHFHHVLGLLLGGRITQLRCIQKASSQEAWTITEGTAALLWITQILIQPLLSLYHGGQHLVHL